MNFKFQKYIVILLIIFSLGFYLRHHNYITLPRHGATFDEFAWTWLGINIIQNGMPISWSSQPQYTERKHLIYQGASFWIVTPYLEHPPLFGLVAGASALVSGAHDMHSVNLHNMRKLPLILGMLSIAMVFILTKALYGKNIALFATLLYSTVPTIVVGSRIVQNENFLIPCWLFSLFLIHKYLRTGKKKFRNFASVIAGLLSLAKVPWLVVGISLGMILSYKGKWKDAFFVGGITVLIFSLFIIYGLVLDKTLFINLWLLQLARYDITFTGFFSIFTRPLLVDRYYLDGWILFGWFAIFWLSKNFKEHFFILIPFLAYLIIYIFAIPDEASHGWYRYPFYPFLLIATALVIKDEWKKISLISLIFIFIVGLSLLGNSWLHIFGFSYFIYRLFILFATIPVIFFLWKKQNQKLPRIFLAAWIVIFIIFNIFSTIIYGE
jgi:hypothetical protein